MRLWNWKFVLSLVVVAVFLFDALWLGPNPVGGAAQHALKDVLPYTDTGFAAFAFLLSVLYILSHGWQWAKARVRGPRTAEAPQPKRKKRRRR